MKQLTDKEYIDVLKLELNNLRFDYKCLQTGVAKEIGRMGSALIVAMDERDKLRKENDKMKEQVKKMENKNRNDNVSK